ncbi:hypothetical protein [Planctomyces sp. SH-PL14]|uniref:hypothetical protein n=1 Tax=Planctomyces sp. SH-PL14 TaxID=1632864 RepID=UPI00078E50C2|nr:hypothetical protein [Planctomyces sp. SH-PL14]AMV16950.1 hypothetical protein VT03_03610 [Planctomyces sp. SH-PL14]
MPGTADSHIEIGSEDFAYLRSLAYSISGSSAILPDAVPCSLERLSRLELVTVMGGRVFITGRGMCAVESGPVSTNGDVLRFRTVDLKRGRVD